MVRVDGCSCLVSIGQSLVRIGAGTASGAELKSMPWLASMLGDCVGELAVSDGLEQVQVKGSLVAAESTTEREYRCVSAT